MKTVVFYLQPKENIWVYNNIQLQEIENQEWVLTINHERQICESIYDAISELTKRGLNPTFRSTEEMDNFNPMDKC